MRFCPREDYIELSKAGELPEDRFLFDPNKPVKRRKKKDVFQANVRSNIYIGASHAVRSFLRRKHPRYLVHIKQNGYPFGGKYGVT